LIDGALAAARAVHFAAVLLLEGTVVFQFIVAEPSIRAAGNDARPAAGMRRVLSWTTALALMVGIASGAAWLLILAGRIVGLSPMQALSEGVDWTLLTQTQFGAVWQLRAVAVALLVISLVVIARAKPPPSWSAAFPVALAAILTGSLAWAGHGAATPGAIGDMHLVADVLHLAVSGIWVGGLMPLAFLLVLARCSDNTNWMATAGEATRRFSALAVASVLVLIVTGIVNTYVLVGSLSGLVGTFYGELLLAKIGLFLLMLGFAAVNRLRLTPRLMGAPSTGAEQHRRILDRLARNSTCEFALGLVVLAIVGVLGTLAPASHHHMPSPGQRIGDHAHQANGCIVNMAEIEQGFRLHSRSASPLVAALVSSDAALVAPVHPSHCNIITFVTL
jgi:putative copper resistance protein D